MKILDLFCGAGGAAMGYHRAFPDAEIVGVDINPQPRYPFTFVQGDAMTYPLAGFDFVHASPPCQDWSTLRHIHDAHGTGHMLPDTLARLRVNGAPWVVENVVGAPMNAPLTLCGTMFDLRCQFGGVEFELQRHRLFECSRPIEPPTSCRHEFRTMGVYGTLSRRPRLNNAKRRPDGDLKAGGRQAAALMDIDWMLSHEIVQAIPPAYTEWIGSQLAAFLAERAA